jgi:chromosome partitioning protein
MKTVSFISQKGGTGKTTLSVHMAMTAYNCGYKVLLSDLDPQKSSSDWFKAREIDGPEARSIKPGALFNAQIEAQKTGFDILVVDTPASTLDLSLAAARISDLALVVSRPTIVDFRALKDLTTLLHSQPVPSALVLNQAPAQRSGREMTMMVENVSLLYALGLHIAPVAIRSRQVYQSSSTNGLSAAEIQTDGPAASETQRLWSYIESRLEIQPPKGQSATREAY